MFLWVLLFELLDVGEFPLNSGEFLQVAVGEEVPVWVALCEGEQQGAIIVCQLGVQLVDESLACVLEVGIGEWRGGHAGEPGGEDLVLILESGVDDLVNGAVVAEEGGDQAMSYFGGEAFVSKHLMYIEEITGVLAVECGA